MRLGWSGNITWLHKFFSPLKHKISNGVTYSYMITWLQAFADDKELHSRVCGDAKPYGHITEESLGLEPLGPKVVKLPFSILEANSNSC